MVQHGDEPAAMHIIYQVQYYLFGTETHLYHDTANRSGRMTEGGSAVRRVMLCLALQNETPRGQLHCMTVSDSGDFWRCLLVFLIRLKACPFFLEVEVRASAWPVGWVGVWPGSWSLNNHSALLLYASTYATSDFNRPQPCQ